ncbi:MAG: amidohydrolase family protein [Clostridia bacterium]|jgi:glutamate-1-semialdehyde 2,1-aminomutase|nr:amidohydrolase family protein [Clostridia bacterium]MBT7122357.1 amidohydrolase family protein [Clostridia bacterium]
MFDINQDDQAIAQQLASFVPNRILDMHMHIYRLEDLALPASSSLQNGPAVAGIAQAKEYYSRMLPSTKCLGGLAIGFPTSDGDKHAINSFVASEVSSDSMCKGSIIIDPTDEKSARDLAEANPELIGLKPYHFFSGREVTWNADIDEYLPEWAWQLADERGMLITLHMVKDDAIADPANQKTITSMCEKYPNAKLILAHAARCFHAPNSKGLSSLAGLHNVWFDSSAICEIEPLLDILLNFGADKLLWGSDYPVCCTRGRAVTLGRDFIFLDQDSVRFDNLNTKCRPIVIGLESFRALSSACKYAKLSESQIDDIFYGNAKRLLGI